MSLLIRLKPVFSSSRLLVPEAEMDIPRMGSKYPGPTPTTGKKQMKKPNRKRISSVMSSSALGNAADGVVGSSGFGYYYFTVKQVSHTMAVIGVGIHKSPLWKKNSLAS